MRELRLLMSFGRQFAGDPCRFVPLDLADSRLTRASTPLA
jgi:hypothetical protein